MTRKPHRHSEQTLTSVHMRYCVVCDEWTFTTSAWGNGLDGNWQKLDGYEARRVVPAEELGPDELLTIISRAATSCRELEEDAQGVQRLPFD